ncbi:MAG: alpha-L-glutamate ligase [Candidatus Parabeggiatoa sp. nov. 1]|nr:MAG: alpha-L-glutamate ligase [Gammaproteobacteria bacterium]
MNANLKLLIQACNELDVAYKTYHSTHNVVELSFNKKSFLFINWTTPLNPQSVVQLCVDKEFFYCFFHNAINLPRTVGFLNPDCDEKYLKYLEAKSYQEIANAIESKFQYPLIVKKNRGSLGAHVFKADDRNSLLCSITSIFDMNSKKPDYVALAQDYIEIKTEYRAIYLNGSLVFAYEKDIENAIYEGNLSPLHWNGAKAVLVADKYLLTEIDQFCSTLFNKMVIPFCGLDVAVDNNGVWWLIEANSSPGFEHIVKHAGDNAVIKMYKEMIMFLIESC